MSVLKSVMDKYPELITHDLSSWLVCHSLARNYNYYRPTLEGEGSLSIFYLHAFLTKLTSSQAVVLSTGNGKNVRLPASSIIQN